MSREKQTPPSADLARAGDVELLREQREANEQLVLATIQANEAADSARLSQASAEHIAVALRSDQEDLRTMADFRERLMAIVGHDLRNPLNTVLMASGLLIARGNLGEADARLVNRVVESGQRMARMITHLLDFTQARLGGGILLALARTDLAAVCRDIAEELRISSSADITLDVSGDLVGTWDGDRLARVVSNLVGNAIDHRSAGTAVVLRVHEEADLIVLEVANQGAAIRPALLPVIFDAFRSADETGARRAEHMGLGLYIAAEIVRAHGGTLAAESGGGTTTFTLRLPRAPTPCPVE
jgi:signal transduction histidine kinase